jgi:adenosylhomocysteine nucleosidase
MLALVAAMDEEVSDLRGSLTAVRTDERDGFVVYNGMLSGKRVLLAKSGVGRQRVERACRSLLDHYPVTAIISFGFAGALNPGLSVGDVVACSSVVASRESFGPQCTCDAALLERAQNRTSPASSRGIGVTAPSLVTSRSQKNVLFMSSGADIVDMESYWIGIMAADSGIPFISVRAISDSARDSLPDLASWRWRHVVPHFVFHPAQAASLYRGMSKARKNMSRFLSRMIEVAD